MPRGHIFPPNLSPKWAQNDPKMAPRWPLGGSWGHLGGKMAPRWSQEGSKVEKPNSFPPCWGPSWYPIFHIFITRVVHKRLGDPLGWHVVSRHQVLDETWCPRGPLGYQKYSKTVELSAKSRFSAFHVKWLWGWVLGCFLGRFWEPSWCQVGPCWAPSWLKMALENHSENLVVKKSCNRFRPMVETPLPALKYY